MTAPKPADALLLDKACVWALSKAASPIVEHYRESAKLAELRGKFILNSAYELNDIEINFYSGLSPKQRESLDAFRTEPRADFWLKSALNANAILSTFDTRKLKKSLLRGYRTFQVALFLAGVMQPLLAPAPPVSRAAYVPLAADEFEIVLAPIHTYIKIGTHAYDYMITAMRKDADTIYENGSTERIRFKIDPREIRRLQEFLESEVGKVGLYYAYPHIGTDCLSNLSRAVNRTTSVYVPDGINRSPTLTEGYFKIRKLLGDRSVESITHRGDWFDAKLANYGPVTPFDSLAATVLFADNLIWAQLDRTPWGWGVHLRQSSPQTE